MTSESAILDRLRTLATHPAARGLADDAALLGDLVLTHDTIVEGVHFLPTDPPESVGWKLAAVNLSDLAAKGATPEGCLLSLTLRAPLAVAEAGLGGEGTQGPDPSTAGSWEEAFLHGFHQACHAFGLPLLGGDTVALPPAAPRVLGLTALGKAGHRVPGRSGARAGDRLWLVGSIGDAAAGLRLLEEDPSARGPLVESYRRPVPLLEIGRQLAPHVTAMMDVSDGLLLDARRLAEASGCGLRVDLSALLLSPAFRERHGDTRDARLLAATGGDDYALLAALPPELTPAFTSSKETSVNVVCVGELTKDGAFQLVDDLGPVPLPDRLGYEHNPS